MMPAGELWSWTARLYLCVVQEVSVSTCVITSAYICMYVYIYAKSCTFNRPCGPVSRTRRLS